MSIKLSDILQIEEPEAYKLHLATWNGNVQPLEVFVRNKGDRFIFRPSLTSKQDRSILLRSFFVLAENKSVPLFSDEVGRLDHKHLIFNIGVRADEVLLTRTDQAQLSTQTPTACRFFTGSMALCI